ncbi:hypothetical protein C0J52_14991 [Blattella germanica]|nr:hypothetical protein C0J52_14991 [Blattella germanica]
MMTMMMMQRLMCHQTQQQAQSPSQQQQQNPAANNSSGNIRSSPPRILSFGHHSYHHIHSNDSPPGIRNLEAGDSRSDKLVVEISAMHQAAPLSCTEAASPQADHSDVEDMAREELVRSRHFRVGRGDDSANTDALTTDNYEDGERNMEMEDEEDDMEMNDPSEDEEELNVDDEDQEENDITSSPVDLTSRRHSSAQLMLANHRLIHAPSDILDSQSPVMCNTNSLSSSPKGDALDKSANSVRASNFRSESVSSVGSGLSVGGNETLRGVGGPSTTTTGSGRRNLAFSVENILDPTKFTGRGQLQQAVGSPLAAAGRLVTAPSAAACCWRPHLDAASPERTDDNSVRQLESVEIIVQY